MKKIIITLLLLIILPSGCLDENEDRIINLEIKNEISKEILGNNIALIKFDNNGNPNVYLNGKKITDNEFLKNEIALNEYGDILWTQTTYQNDVTEIYLNGSVISNSDGYNFNPLFHNDHIIWLSKSLDHNMMCLSAAQVSCINLDYIPDAMRTVNEQTYIIGYSPQLNNFVLEEYDQNHQLSRRHLSESTLLFYRKNGKTSIFELNTNRPDNSDFFSLKWLFYTQKHDPYSFSNDFMGRISNNLSYRVEGILTLLKKTKKTWLKNYLNQIIYKVTHNTDASGLFFSKKYSVTYQSEIPFAVDNSIIWTAILKSYPYLDEGLKKNVLEKAQRVFAHFEHDWHEDSLEYRFPKHPDIAYDGVFLPWNQQNALGLFSLQLHKITDEDKYLNRAIILYTNFISAIQMHQNSPVWHYWPDKFYLGWPDNTFDSYNVHSLPPSTDERFEDYLHADLSVQFIRDMEEHLNLPWSIDLDSITNKLQINDYAFSLFISGHAASVPPSWNYFPLNNFVYSNNIKNQLKNKDLIVAHPEYDNQLTFLSYSKLALEASTTENMYIELVSFPNKQEQKTIVFDLHNYSHFFDKLSLFLFLNEL